MQNLKQILTIIDMVVMVFLIAVVVMQNKSSGLSNVFGGGGVVTTRRGGDKWMFYATIVLGFLFAGISFALLFIR